METQLIESAVTTTPAQEHHKEIESPAELEKLIRDGEPLAKSVFKGLDLRGYTEALLRGPLADCIFLGCTLAPEALVHAQKFDALIFPSIANLPFKPYRGDCYTIDGKEGIYTGFERGVPGSYARTPDALIYDYYDRTEKEGNASFRDTLAMRLHDHAITDALNDLLKKQNVVAFMGGHKLGRGTREFRDVALMARELRRRGFLVATGGGPGAMEAGNLGAWLAVREDEALDVALKILARAPSFDHGEGEKRERIERWLDAAFEVRERFGSPDPMSPGRRSLGIPTWFYGHEPPNAFATHLAKYFANSVREEGVLAIANCGVIFAPGSAGTIQEIFQDAAQNQYATFGAPSPMVFFGESYWTDKKPVYPLLKKLAEENKDHPYGQWVTVSDDPDKVVAFIESYVQKGGLARRESA